jgi:acyl-coenzyme A synthetase/AMP-(fatty) acid ligase
MLRKFYQMNNSDCIGNTFLKHLAEGPNEIQIIQGEEKISRDKFAKNASGIRKFFIAQGVKCGDVVGLANTNQVTTIEAIFALWSLGASPITLDFKSSNDEIEHIKKITKLNYLFSDFNFMIKNSHALKIPDRDTLIGEISDLTFKSSPILTADFVQSSGTTALPKIKPTDTKSLYIAIKRYSLTEATPCRRNILTCSNLNFPAMRFYWYQAIFFGKTIISVPLFFSIQELDAALSSDYAEEAKMAPVTIIQLISYVKDQLSNFSEPRYPNIYNLQSVGGPLVGKKLCEGKTLLSENISVTYSSSEIGVISRLSGRDIEKAPNSVGKPYADMKVSILSDSNENLPWGLVGNIHVEKDRKVLMPGDMGFLDEDGYLYITGRQDEYICRKGITFMAGDLEARIQKILGITECSIFCVNGDVPEEDTVIAAIGGDYKKLKEIKSQIRLKISSNIRPNYIRIYDKLPRTSGLKLARNNLRLQYLAEQDKYDDI